MYCHVNDHEYPLFCLCLFLSVQRCFWFLYLPLGYLCIIWFMSSSCSLFLYSPCYYKLKDFQMRLCLIEDNYFSEERILHKLIRHPSSFGECVSEYIHTVSPIKMNRQNMGEMEGEWCLIYRNYFLIRGHIKSSYLATMCITLDPCKFFKR